MIRVRTSLYGKLTLAFILIAVITAGLVALLIRVTSADRLRRLIVDQQRETLKQELIVYYQSYGTWDGVEEKWPDFQLPGNEAPFQDNQLPSGNFATPAPQPDKLGDNPQSFLFDRRSIFGLADQDGVVIISVDRKYPQGSLLPEDVLSQGEVIKIDGEKVGTILPTPQRPDFNPAEDLFLQRTTQAIYLATLGALVVALAVGILLAWTIARPLQALTQAAQNMAEGNLNQQVSVTSKDEIGKLATAFNRMSQEIVRGNQLRQQMTADIAHDLRTPLTVIAGYIESMRDGILQPTEQRLNLIYSEIERLQRLVADLRMLSQVDAGELPLHPQDIPPIQILQHSAELFRHHAEQQQVTLEVEPNGDLPDIFVDEARLLQVMDNLISNALRYTPSGGKITLSAKANGATIDITVHDTGTGIPQEEIPYIFNRFHRVDKSRSSETGQSGLGLSIVKALVEAQQGRIWVESTPGEGSAFHIELPQAKKE